MNDAAETRERPAGQAERHNAILDRISGMGSVAVSEMAELLGVSEATIRRDLDHLATRRLVERTHGGALAHQSVSGPARDRRRMLSEHRAAAKALAQRCQDARSIAVTGSLLGDLIGEQFVTSTMTILTNVVDVAAKLVAAPRIELVVTGGVRRQGTPLLLGGMTESAAASFHVDRALIVADAISPSGASFTLADAARTAAAMAAHATRVIVACPPEGIGQDGFGQICGITDVAEILTWTPGVSGTGPNPSALRALRELGVPLTVVGESADSP